VARKFPVPSLLGRCIGRDSGITPPVARPTEGAGSSSLGPGSIMWCMLVVGMFIVVVDATVVGATVVGASVGGAVAGASVVGASVVGASVVGAVVGATVGGAVAGASVVDDSIVGDTAVGVSVTSGAVVAGRGAVAAGSVAGGFVGDDTLVAVVMRGRLVRALTEAGTTPALASALTARLMVLPADRSDCSAPAGTGRFSRAANPKMATAAPPTRTAELRVKLRKDIRFPFQEDTSKVETLITHSQQPPHVQHRALSVVRHT
jgi:hypothetical protein